MKQIFSRRGDAAFNVFVIAAILFVGGLIYYSYYGTLPESDGTPPKTEVASEPVAPASSTPEPQLSSPPPTAPQTPIQSAPPAPVAKTYVVEINDAGFRPSSLTIQRGDTVEFINKGKNEHWPASDIHPLHDLCPYFDPRRPLASGETYKVTFNEARECPMHDHLAPQFEGTIIIREKSGAQASASLAGGSPAPIAFSGARLAGTSAPLLEYNKSDFDKVLASDKILVLYFYANWCPICIAEFPKMQSAFNELATDKVVGFRVNYNDNETTSDEKDLARAHGVAYQHTKVLIKGGTRILKAPDGWDKARYLSEINKALSS
ncbi:hypothetical protein C4571_02415 [Candidatus Parcubacteria bacterium]|nr:MAG: hypothetical protein C4571_02415 [Candidatus Parcubacteria bacterium]